MRRVILRRQFPPIFRTILSSKYACGVYEQLLNLEHRQRIREHELRSRIDRKVRNRTYQPIYEGFSNLIWRRNNKYEVVSKYVDNVIATTDAMNYAICLGFHVWYGLIPSIMLSSECYNVYDIINPETVARVKAFTANVSPGFQQVCNEKLTNEVMRDPVGALRSSTSGVGYGQEMETFDPLGLIKKDEIREVEAVSSRKQVLFRDLVIVCLAACLLISICYTTFSGTELCNIYRNLPS